MAPTAAPIRTGHTGNMPLGISVPAASKIAVPGTTKLRKASDSLNAATKMISAAQAECVAMKSATT